MRNIPVHHDGFDHEALRDMLYNHEGSFVLSYNNCETIREWYKDFHQVFPKWNYSMGTGETRIGKNRKQMGISNQKDSHEILIIKESILVILSLLTPLYLHFTFFCALFKKSEISREIND